MQNEAVLQRVIDGARKIHPEYESESVLVAQSCPALCNPMDGSPPGSSVRGILQARILELVAIPFSRGSSSLYDNQIFSTYDSMTLF